MVEINHYGICYVGRRKNNEDAILQLKIAESTWCFAVADGMGGAEGGEIASSEAVAQLEHTLKAAFLKKETKGLNLKKILEEAFQKAQDRIAQLAKEQPQLQGMGTTMTVLLIHDDKYVWGNIGDSRIYRAVKNNIDQITTDHTYIEQYREEHGEEVPENIARRYGNIITRAISGNDDEADLFPANNDYETLVQGTAFLLCSDGLITSKTADSGAGFLPYIMAYKKLDKIAEQLVSKAFTEGSTDNISAVLVAAGKKPVRKNSQIKVYPYPPKADQDREHPAAQQPKSTASFVKNVFKDPLKIIAGLLMITLVALTWIYLDKQYREPQRQKAVADEQIADEPELIVKEEPADVMNDIGSGVQRGESFQQREILYSHDDLVRVRVASLEGISRLLVAFLEDEQVIKAVENRNIQNPIEMLVGEIFRERPGYIDDIFYVKTIEDSLQLAKIRDSKDLKAYVLADTPPRHKYPFLTNDKKYYVNRTKAMQYVFIRVGDFGKVSPLRRDYSRSTVVFAHEAGLTGLTRLMAEINHKYFHMERLRNELIALNDYLAYYQSGRLERHTGYMVNKEFNKGAVITRGIFIQHLNRLNDRPVIDICVPVKNTEGAVFRAGYVIH